MTRPAIQAAAAILLLASAGAGAAPPPMTPSEAVALFAAAGFPLGPDKHPRNRCGEAANPKVTFVDMNGDKRPEALFIDEGACYQPDGRWYAIAAQDSGGRWHAILAGEGSVGATGTAFGGWFVLTATRGGRTTRLHYDGARYVPADGAAPSPPSPAAVPAPAPAKRGYPTDGWKAPFSFARLSLAEQAAIMTPAGLKREGGKWQGCDGDSHVAPDGVELKDLNGDGRPEAIVVDAGYDCYGNNGQAFTILQPTPLGWKVMMQAVGMLGRFLPSKGAAGYPDLVAGGAGVCVGIWRSDGTRYTILRRQIEDGGPDAGKPCPN